MERRAHIWAGWFVWGLLGATAALAVAGIAARFLPLDAADAKALEGFCVLALAGVAGFSLAVANSAATAISALAGKGKPIALGLAVIVAIITGLVSLAGVHLAWAVLTGQPDALPSWDAVHAAGFALAFVKPAQSFVIGAWRELEQDAASADARAELDFRHQLALTREANLHAERMARIGAKSAPPEPAPAGEPEREPAQGSPRPAKRTHLKAVEKTAIGAAAAAMLLASGSQAEAAPIASQNCPAEPANCEPETAGEPGAEARALARSLIAQGERPRAVHLRTHVPEGTCKRWAAAFKAGRWAA